MEEEADLDSADEDAVSSDEDEVGPDRYEMNSFVDDNSAIAQTQGTFRRCYPWSASPA